MKLIQNILKTSLFSMLLFCSQQILASQDAPQTILLKDLFAILQANNKKPFTIKSATVNFNDVTVDLQKAANLGLFYIPKNFSIYDCPPLNVSGIPCTTNSKELTIIFSINNVSYNLVVTSCGTQTTGNGWFPTLIPDSDTWNIQDYYGSNDPRVCDTYLITDLNQIKNTASTLPAIPASGAITLKILDRYLKTIPTPPVFTIENGSWYGIMGNSSNLTDIVQKSLQQHAEKGLLAVPTNMSEYFGKDPLFGTVKKLYIKFTMNGISYNMTISENNTYKPGSKYIYKIPAETTNSLLSIQQNPEPSEKLTADSFKKIILNNDCKSFVINNAWYGTSSRNIDVTTQMQSNASKGLFTLPKNMNTFFGRDPVPGIVKTLFVNFTMQDKRYTIFIPESNHDNFWVDSVVREDGGYAYVKNFMHDGHQGGGW